MLNYSFAFGQDIALMAVRLGNSPLHAAYAVWPIALAGGFLPNFAFSIYLLRRNRSWSVFRVLRTDDALLPILMGFLWMGSFALYGMSAIYLGPYGTSIGWGLFQIIHDYDRNAVWRTDRRMEVRFARLKAAVGCGPCLLDRRHSIARYGK